MRLKNFIGLSLSILALTLGTAFAAVEEKWPTKPIELVVGFVPGGSADLTARTYTPIMSKELGVPITIIYKPGATGALAAEYVAKAKPDGYTIFEATLTQISRRPHTHSVNYSINDFTYIHAHSDSCWVFVIRKDAPWKDYRDFLEYARKSSAINYGTSGAYNSAHIIAEWIARREKLNWSFVPFKGFGEVIPALLGGHIDFGGSSGGHAPLIEGGKLRTLIQLSGDVVDETKVPNLKELYPDFPTNLQEMIGTNGLVGPKGIPAPIVQKLANALRKATEGEEFKRFTKNERYKIVNWDSTKMYDAVKADSEAFGSFLKTIGFKKE